MTDHERLLDELRPVAFAIAYRMLGSVSEADDVVQEALLRVHQALDGGERIASPRAFAATVTTLRNIEAMTAVIIRHLWSGGDPLSAFQLTVAESTSESD
jgi:DNA-directed RNA polymerase specialized sigma24 family protein